MVLSRSVDANEIAIRTAAKRDRVGSAVASSQLELEDSGGFLISQSETFASAPDRQVEYRLVEDSNPHRSRAIFHPSLEGPDDARAEQSRLVVIDSQQGFDGRGGCSGRAASR